MWVGSGLEADLRGIHVDLELYAESTSNLLPIHAQKKLSVNILRVCAQVAILGAENFRSDYWRFLRSKKSYMSKKKTTYAHTLTVKYAYADACI